MSQRKRNDRPARYRKLRDSATVKSATKQIAKVFGLPESSIRLMQKNGRKARTDKKIGALREDWA